MSLVDEYTLDVTAGGVTADPGLGAHMLRFMLQPVTQAETVIHGHLQGELAAQDRLAVLKHHNWLLSAVRDRAEAAS